jgi:hypothetical protein
MDLWNRGRGNQLELQHRMACHKQLREWMREHRSLGMFDWIYRKKILRHGDYQPTFRLLQQLSRMLLGNLWLLRHWLGS